MPHSTGQQLSRCLLGVLALASPLLARGDEGNFAPVIDLHPRHTEPASPSLEEPNALIVTAEVIPLPADKTSPVRPLAKPQRESSTVRMQRQPAVRLAVPFDPTKGAISARSESKQPRQIDSPKFVVQGLRPSAPVQPIIQLAETVPMLAILQRSPSASDLPTPTEELPTEEQMADTDEKELEAFELSVKPIHKLSTRITPQEGELPKNYAKARFVREGEISHRLGYSRSNLETEMMWEAPALCHRPLYFEEINLERHGYKIPLVQPALSAAHFFGRVPLLPYMVASEGHFDCQYSLGHYRPGDYAPYSLYVPRLRLDASVAEVAVVAGAILVLP